MPLVRTPPTGLTRWVAHLRWAFMPLGLAALVAVGVHAAADTVDDKLLGLLDDLQARWDALWSTWSWGAHLVSPFGLSARTQLARGATLVWELGSDLVLALPMLAYREVDRPEASAVWMRCRRQASALRWTRAPLTLPIVLAGACAIARLVQGTAYLGLQGEVPSSAAEAWSRMAAILALALVVATLGWRAAMQALAAADAASTELPPRERWTAGVLGSLWVAPLAVAAAFDASPLLSFFR